MALVKITFDSSSVTSKMDADVNHFLVSGINGIFYTLLGRCQASVSNNYITFQSGYVQIYGRRIYVEPGTKISVSLDGSAYGYVVIKVDLGNNSVTLEKKESSTTWPSLTREDLMNGGLIHEFPMCRYTKTASSITLESWEPTYLLEDVTRINNKASEVINRVDDKYGPLWDAYSVHSYGTTYIFEDITSLNAFNSIISVYVGGCNVLFSGASVGGSGGMVYYRHLGVDKTLSCQLTNSGLYIQASDGSQPRYARAIR